VPDDLTSQLDEDFEPWARALRPEVVEAIIRWQQGPPNRWYEQVQRGYREGPENRDVMANMALLDEACCPGSCRVT